MNKHKETYLSMAVFDFKNSPEEKAKSVCAQRIKTLNDIIDQEDYAEALEGRGELYQYYQEDAYKLCRFILLFCDRDAVSEDLSNETFKHMRAQEGTGHIEENELSWFYLQK